MEQFDIVDGNGQPIGETAAQIFAHVHIYTNAVGLEIAQKYLAAKCHGQADRASAL